MENKSFKKLKINGIKRNTFSSTTKNAGKSFKYLMTDITNDLFPEINEISGMSYDVQTSTESGLDKLKELSSETSDALKKTLTNAKKQLTTGNFYNRSNNIEEDYDDYGYDFDFSPSESTNIFQDKRNINISNNSEAIYESTDTVIRNSNRINNTNIEILNSINNNISKIVDFNRTTLTTYAEESTRYFADSMSVLNDISRAFKEKESEYSFSESELNKIIPSNTIDPNQYAKVIWKNTNDIIAGKLGIDFESVIGMGSMMASFSDDFDNESKSSIEKIAGKYIENPVGELTKGLVKNLIIPSFFKTSIKSFRDSLADFNKGMITHKFNEWGKMDVFQEYDKLKKDGNDNSNFAKSLIGNLLKVRTPYKRDVDLSKYEKGVVPFDGVTKKSIIEVIPGYLRKILSAVSGNEEVLYNYNDGKFIGYSDYDKQLKEDLQSSATFKFFDEQMGFIKKLSEDGIDINTDKVNEVISTIIESKSLPLFKEKEEYLKKFGDNKDLANDFFNYLENDLDITKRIALPKKLYDALNEQKQFMENIELEKELNGYSQFKSFADVKSRKFVDGKVIDDEDSLLNNNINPKDNRNIIKKLRELKIKENRNIEKTDLTNLGFNIEQEDEVFDILRKANTLPNEEKNVLNNRKGFLKRIFKKSDSIFESLTKNVLHKTEGFLHDILFDTQTSKKYSENKKLNLNQGNDGGNVAEKDIKTTTSLETELHNAFGFSNRGKNESFKVKMDKLFTDLSTTIKDLFDDVGEFIKDKFNPIKDRAIKFLKNTALSLRGEKTDNGYYKDGKLSKVINKGIDFARRNVHQLTGKEYTLSDGTTINENSEGYLQTKLKKVDEKLFGASKGKRSIKNRFNSEEGIIGSAVQKIKQSFYNLQYELIGNDDNINQVKKQIKKIIPDAGKGAGIGVLASLFLPGGPILGAVIGSGVGIANKSKRLNKFLFGEENSEKTLFNNIQEKVKKDFNIDLKSASKSTLIGGILGSLVGGPLLGSITGMGLNIANNSQSFNRLIFGDENSEKTLFRNIKEKFKGNKFNTTLGTSVGVLGSLFLPGGPIVGAMVGGLTGLFTEGDHLKNYFFGKGNAESGYQRGLFSRIKDQISYSITNPFKQWASKNMAKNINFVEEKIMMPLYKTIPLIARNMQLNASKIFKNMFGGIADKIRQGFKPITDKFFGPLRSLIGKVFNGLGNTVKGLISLPFKGIDKFGDYIARKNIEMGDVRSAEHLSKVNQKKQSVFERSAERLDKVNFNNDLRESERLGLNETLLKDRKSYERAKEINNKIKERINSDYTEDELDQINAVKSKYNLTKPEYDKKQRRNEIREKLLKENPNLTKKELNKLSKNMMKAERDTINSDSLQEQAKYNDELSKVQENIKRKRITDVFNEEGISSKKEINSLLGKNSISKDVRKLLNIPESDLNKDLKDATDKEALATGYLQHTRELIETNNEQIESLTENSKQIENNIEALEKLTDAFNKASNGGTEEEQNVALNNLVSAEEKVGTLQENKDKLSENKANIKELKQKRKELDKQETKDVNNVNKAKAIKNNIQSKLDNGQGRGNILPKIKPIKITRLGKGPEEQANDISNVSKAKEGSLDEYKLNKEKEQRNEFGNTMLSSITNIGETVKSHFEWVKDYERKKGILKFFGKMLKGVGSIGLYLGGKLWDIAKSKIPFLSNMSDAIKSVFTGSKFLSSVTDGVGKVFTKNKSMISKINAAKVIVNGASVSNGSDIVTDVLDDVLIPTKTTKGKKGLLKKVKNTVTKKGFVKSVAKTAVNSIKHPGKALTSVGTFALKPLVKGLTSAGGSITKLFPSLLKFAPKIASLGAAVAPIATPLVGALAVAGSAYAVYKGYEWIKNNVNVKAIVDTVKNIGKTVGKVVEGIAKGVVNVIKLPFTLVSKAVNGVIDTIKNDAKRFTNWIGDKFDNVKDKLSNLNPFKKKDNENKDRERNNVITQGTGRGRRLIGRGNLFSTPINQLKATINSQGTNTTPTTNNSNNTNNSNTSDIFTNPLSKYKTNTSSSSNKLSPTTFKKQATAQSTVVRNQGGVSYDDYKNNLVKARQEERSELMLNNLSKISSSLDQQYTWNVEMENKKNLPAFLWETADTNFKAMNKLSAYFTTGYFMDNLEQTNLRTAKTVQKAQMLAEGNANKFEDNLTKMSTDEIIKSGGPLTTLKSNFDSVNEKQQDKTTIDKIKSYTSNMILNNPNNPLLATMSSGYKLINNLTPKEIKKRLNEKSREKIEEATPTILDLFKKGKKKVKDTTEDVKTNVTNTVVDFKTTSVDPIVQQLQEYSRPYLDNIKDFSNKTITRIEEFAKPYTEKVYGIVDDIGNYLDKIKGGVTKFALKAAGIGAAAFLGIKAVKFGVRKIIEGFKALGRGIKKLGQSIVKGLGNLKDLAVKTSKNMIKVGTGIVKAIGGVAVSAFNKAKEGFIKGKDKIVEIGTNIVDSGKKLAHAVGDKISQMFKKTKENLDKMKDWSDDHLPSLDDVFGDMTKMIKKPIDGTKKIITNIYTKVNAYFKDVDNELEKTQFKQDLEKITKPVTNFFKGIFAAIKKPFSSENEESMIEKLSIRANNAKVAVSNFFTNIFSKIKNMFKLNKKSNTNEDSDEEIIKEIKEIKGERDKFFRGLFRNLRTKVSDTMEKEQKDLSEADIDTTVKTTVKTSGNIFKDLFKSIVTKSDNRFANADLKDVESHTENLFTTIKNAFKNALDRITKGIVKKTEKVDGMDVETSVSLSTDGNKKSKKFFSPKGSTNSSSSNNNIKDKGRGIKRNNILPKFKKPLGKGTMNTNIDGTSKPVVNQYIENMSVSKENTSKAKQSVVDILAEKVIIQKTKHEILTEENLAKTKEKTYEKFNKVMSKVSEVSDKVFKSTDKNEQNISKMKQSTDDAKNNVDKMKKNSSDSNNIVGRLFNKANKGIDNMVSDISDMNDEIENVSNSFDKVTGELENIAKSGNVNSKKINKRLEEDDDKKSTSSKVKNKLKDATKDKTADIVDDAKKGLLNSVVEKVSAKLPKPVGFIIETASDVIDDLTSDFVTSKIESLFTGKLGKGALKEGVSKLKTKGITSSKSVTTKALSTLKSKTGLLKGLGGKALSSIKNVKSLGALGKVSSLASKMGGLASGGLGGLTSGLSSGLGSLMGGATSAFGSIGSMATGLMSSIGPAIAAAGPVLLPIIGVAAGGFAAFKAIKWFKDNNIGEKVKESFTKMGEGIKNSKIGKIVGNVFGSAKEFLLGENGIVDKIKNNFSIIGNGIKNIFGKVGSAIKETIFGPFNTIKDVLTGDSSLQDKIIDSFKVVGNTLKKFPPFNIIDGSVKLFKTAKDFVTGANKNKQSTPENNTSTDNGRGNVIKLPSILNKTNTSKEEFAKRKTSLKLEFYKNFFSVTQTLNEMNQTLKDIAGLSVESLRTQAENQPTQTIINNNSSSGQATTTTTTKPAKKSKSGNIFTRTVKYLFGKGNNVQNNRNKKIYGRGEANGFTYYNQEDSRWADYDLSANGDGDTIGSAGCGPTATSMALSSLGIDSNPIEASEFAKSGGYKVANEGVRADFISDYAASKGVNYQGRYVDNYSQNDIDISLASGRPVLALGSSATGMGNGNHNTGRGSDPYTDYGHYVMITGKDENGNYRVNDPLNEANNHRSFSPDEILGKTSSYWVDGAVDGSVMPEMMQGRGNLETINGMVYYKQGDPEWKSVSYPPGGTIGSSGCGPTSAAMVLSQATKRAIKPPETIKWSLDHNYRVPGGGTSHAYFPAIGKAYGVELKQSWSDKEAIREALEKRFPVIFSGNGAPPFTTGGHFVVGAYKDGSTVYINDPVSQERSKGYNYDTIIKQSKNAWISSVSSDGTPITNTNIGDGSTSTNNNGSSTTTADSSNPLEQILSETTMFLTNTLFGKEYTSLANRSSGSSGSSSSTSTSTGGSGGNYDTSSAFKIVSETLKTKDQKNFIDAIDEGAMNGYSLYNLSPAITLAQGIEESGWGSSNLAINAKNLFGMKGSYNGASYTSSSGSTWRQYPSWNESVIDHNRLLGEKDIYSKVIQATNWEDAVNELGKTPYCTDPAGSVYAQKLKKTINAYKLYEYDNLKPINSASTSEDSNRDNEIEGTEATSGQGRGTTKLPSTLPMSAKDLNISVTDLVSSKLTTPTKTQAEAAKKDKEKASTNKFFGHPLPSHPDLQSAFGMRIHPVHKTKKMHTGVDLGVAGPGDLGAPILASAPGKVTHSGDAGGYGWLVKIDHGNGFETRYAHASKLIAKVGDQVQRGQEIAKVGGAKGAPGAGTSTGPHLHFEVRKDGTAVDPMKYIDKTIDMSSFNSSSSLDSSSSTSTSGSSNSSAVEASNPLEQILSETSNFLTSTLFGKQYVPGGSTTSSASYNGAVSGLSNAGDDDIGNLLKDKHHLSAVFEVLGQDVKNLAKIDEYSGFVSSGQGDAGGVSYGIPQFATKTGSINNFVNWLKSAKGNLANKLTGSVGSSSFKSSWKELGKTDGGQFKNAQFEFMDQTFWNKGVPTVEKQTGIPLNNRSIALQSTANSIFTQHGPGSTVFGKAVGANARDMKDKDIIAKVYDYKYSNVDNHFKSSSSSVRNGVRNRIQKEKSLALQMYDREVQVKGGNSSNTEQPTTTNGSGNKRKLSIGKGVKRSNIMKKVNQYGKGTENVSKATPSLVKADSINRKDKLTNKVQNIDKSISISQNLNLDLNKVLSLLEQIKDASNITAKNTSEINAKELKVEVISDGNVQTTDNVNHMPNTNISVNKNNVTNEIHEDINPFLNFASTGSGINNGRNRDNLRKNIEQIALG